MQFIPEEIVYHFFDPTILSQSDLCSTALVCRAWRSASQIRLWQFPVTLRLFKHEQSLLDHNELGSQITKDVTLVLAESDEEAREVYKKGVWRAKVEAVVERSKGIERLRLVRVPHLDVRLLQRFPGLKYLDLGRTALFDGAPRWPFVPRFTLQSLSFRDISDSLHSIYIPLVQHSSVLTHLSLDWNRYLSSAEASDMNTIFALIAPTVTNLSLPSLSCWYDPLIAQTLPALANITALQTLTLQRHSHFSPDLSNPLRHVLNALSRLPHLIIETYYRPSSSENPEDVTCLIQLFDALSRSLRAIAPAKRVEALTVVLRARGNAPRPKGYYDDTSGSQEVLRTKERVQEAFNDSLEGGLDGIVAKYELVFCDDPYDP